MWIGDNDLVVWRGKRIDSQSGTATAGAESDSEVKVDYVAVNAASAGELVTTTIVITYDGLNRLAKADYSSGENFEYVYDAVGPVERGELPPYQCRGRGDTWDDLGSSHQRWQQGLHSVIGGRLWLR